jgi:hypothetical protein
VRPERFELPTYSSGGCRSIQLSYGRTAASVQRRRERLNRWQLACFRLADYTRVVDFIR